MSCQEAFDILKERLTEAPVLVHYDPALATIVTCDSSGTAMGAVLSQVHPAGKRPVAFASRTLSAAERKYSAGERESLACVWACEHWHLFLFGREFTLKTDHQALTTLLATNGSGHKPLRIYRWSDRLHQYHFHPLYKPGKDIPVADALSRLSPSDFSTSDISTSDKKFIHEILAGNIHDFITPTQLSVATQNDSVLHEVIKNVRSG